MNPEGLLKCVMGRLVHTGLGSSSLVAHVLPYPPPAPVISFVLGAGVIYTQISFQTKSCSSFSAERRRAQPCPIDPRMRLRLPHPSNKGLPSLLFRRERKYIVPLNVALGATDPCT
jgi:hypothetical protein